MRNVQETVLQEFIDGLRSAFADAALEGPARGFTTELFAALGAPGSSGHMPPAVLPVCAHLPAALQSAKARSSQLANVASAFEGLAHRLTWKVRPSGGPHASENWAEGHANTIIVGQGGLEERSDIAIGASLLAPNVRYPDHTHPPEELYLVLTDGRFQHGEDSWQSPGPGGTFHNAPGIKHAMASEAMPLLAIWTMIIR